VSQAYAMEQQQAQQAQQTGIQAQHNNNTEAVQAGQVASGSQTIEDEALRIKQGNIQSGSQYQGTNATSSTQEMTEAQKQLQAQAQQAQQEAKAKAAAKTTKKAD